MVCALFGLTCFWNIRNRTIIRKMIDPRIPKGYMVEKIGWFTCERLERGVYSIYVQIASKNRNKRFFSHSYWENRANCFGIFDIINNKCSLHFDTLCTKDEFGGKE